MQRGNRLELVSKWLGHNPVPPHVRPRRRGGDCQQNPCITYRHYWTDPVMLQDTVPRQEEEAEEEADAALYDALRAKIEECERLQSMLRGLSAAPPP